MSALAMRALFRYGAADVRSSWSAEQIAALVPRGRFRSIAGAGNYLNLTHPAVRAVAGGSSATS